MMGKPTVPEVAPLIDAIYQTPEGGVGCCLHAVIDDGNVDNGNVEYALELAIKRGHPKCEEVARLLLLMSRTQRGKLAGMSHYR